MKTKKIFLALSLIVSVGLLTQCEKKWDSRGGGTPDDDSDRPEWAGGNTEDNPHIRGNDDSGTTRGGDYGDLYQLLRSLYVNEAEDLLGSGVPIMIEIAGEYYVQPVGDNGEALELNEEGELVDPELATEVDFGRLNIVRSPTSVLDQALLEALKVLAPPSGVATISQDFCGRLHSYYENEEGDMVHKTIDSPRENMALYRTIMQDLTDTRLSFLFDVDGPYNFDPLVIAASCFAAGSDKTGTVDIDEVVYINGFIDCIGNNPILNEHDYDFSHEQNYYYNFEEPGAGQGQFQYNRSVYGNRWLSIMEVTGPGTHQFVEKTVLDAMEDGGLFTERWGDLDPGDLNSEGNLTGVKAFAMAVDDAVQVLDYVHGDSNIEFLPNYEE